MASNDQPIMWQLNEMIKFCQRTGSNRKIMFTDYLI